MVTCRPPNLEGLGDLGPSPSPKSLPAAGFTQGTPEGIPPGGFPIGKLTFYLQQSKVFRNPNRMRIYIYIIHIVVILKYWSR